jgi:hypothetical protein
METFGLEKYFKDSIKKFNFLVLIKSIWQMVRKMKAKLEKVLIIQRFIHKGFKLGLKLISWGEQRDMR